MPRADIMCVSVARSSPAPATTPRDQHLIRLDPPQRHRRALTHARTHAPTNKQTNKHVQLADPLSRGDVTRPRHRQPITPPHASASSSAERKKNEIASTQRTGNFATRQFPFKSATKGAEVSHRRQRRDSDCGTVAKNKRVSRCSLLSFYLRRHGDGTGRCANVTTYDSRSAVDRTLCCRRGRGRGRRRGARDGAGRPADEARLQPREALQQRRQQDPQHPSAAAAAAAARRAR